MVYSTDASKWRAYQFLDPFAAGCFFVCNKITTNFCRPDCDAHPITELHLEIKFVDKAEDAVKLGFSPCASCDPMSVPSIDVNLLLVTVREINAMIGFVPPLLDDDEEKVTETIKENIIEHNAAHRRMLVPANTYSKKKNNTNSTKTAYAVSKNDSEHYRLIDLACRHLALAAAVSIFAPSGNGSSGSSSPKQEESASLKKKGGRRRRGGVLGFKELATKSKLSAWHFHRVFKSIIGLTPKTYGDMCWEFLEKEKEAMEAQETATSETTRQAMAQTPGHASSHASSSETAPNLGRVTPSVKEEYTDFGLQDAYVTPPQSHGVVSPQSGHKRARGPEDFAPSKRTPYANVSSPHLSPFSNLKLEDALDSMAGGLSTRAISVPNMNAYSAPTVPAAAPNSLFQHLRNFDYFVNKDELPSTESVFASVLPMDSNDQLIYGEEPGSSTTYLNEISPATIDDISPLNGTSAMISPDTMPSSDMSFGMYDAHLGFALAVDTNNDDEAFPNMELFPDLFKSKNEYPSDYNINDPLLSGLAPEMMANIDF